jgi:hypothetical protein
MITQHGDKDDEKLTPKQMAQYVVACKVHGVFYGAHENSLMTDKEKEAIAVQLDKLGSRIAKLLGDQAYYM